jgi:transcriptional regulator with XRE-family HTH domain
LTGAKPVRQPKKVACAKRAAMALEAEIDRTYASQIERGVGNPSLKVICSLAAVLQVHPNTLFAPKA